MSLFVVEVNKARFVTAGVKKQQQKTIESNEHSALRKATAWCRCFPRLARRLRSAVRVRGVRSIVAGPNGGQSCTVALAPRTITLGLSEFLAHVRAQLLKPALLRTDPGN